MKIIMLQNKSKIYRYQYLKINEELFLVKLGFVKINFFNWPPDFREKYFSIISRHAHMSIYFKFAYICNSI